MSTLRVTVVICVTLLIVFSFREERFQLQNTTTEFVDLAIPAQATINASVVGKAAIPATNASATIILPPISIPTASPMSPPTVSPTTTMRQHLQQPFNATLTKQALPQWMQDYFVWHAAQRKNQTSETKYLVARCLSHDKCGGISDRFKPLPFFIMMAAHSFRVLLIYWEKPCNLQHFLVPPEGGLDWRVNDTLVELKEIHDEFTIFRGKHDRGKKGYYQCRGFSKCVVNVYETERFTKYRTITVLLYGGGEIVESTQLFDLWMDDPVVSPTRDLMEFIFPLLFEPSPELQTALDQEMSSLNLADKQYTAVHIRAKAPAQIPEHVLLRETNTTIDAKTNAAWVDIEGGLRFQGAAKEWMQGVFENAIECAISVSDNDPLLYLASDTIEATKFMERTSTHHVVAATKANESLHVDFEGNVGRPPSDFMQTFLDLFLMSRAKCMSRGTGGFAWLAERIGGIDCLVWHRNHSGDLQNCSR